MAYDFYLNNCLLPVAPSRLKITQDGRNTTLDLINEGEINILKSPKLKEISFSFLIPQVKYPFAVYDGQFRSAEYYLNYIGELNESKRHFRFIISRTLPSGKVLFSTNIMASMESMTVTESAEEGFDLIFDVVLKQFKAYGSSVITVKDDGYAFNKGGNRPEGTNKAPTIGCDIVVNGRLHGTSYGDAPGQTRTNYHGKINFINPGSSHPYHITTPDGLWQGWVTKESITLI